jgi:extracellular factor (EF) 3-hydroxypalmitic acid methyl ester biosynthesis protein
MLTATLIKDKESFPIEITENSRYALFIKFQTDFLFADPATQGHHDFDRVILRIEDERFELDSCRFLPMPTGNPPEGWLVFLTGLHDMSELLSRKKLITSDVSFWNLSLILGQKDRIPHQFKELSSNLTFELSVCKQFFDDLDRKYIKEPGQVQEELKMQVIQKEGRDFLDFFHSKTLELHALTEGLDKEQHQNQGFFFRKQIWEYILHSKFLTRVNLKPRGYAGDYEMMRMIYDNEYVGGSIFAKLMHKYPLETKSAEAVRNRKVMVPRLIDAAYSEKKERGNNEPFRIMSIACGPATEIHGIFSQPESFEKFELTLLDQDQEALLAAKSSVHSVEMNSGKKIKVDYRAESVRILSRTTYLSRHPGKFDFIYSMGLFDYLIPQVAGIIFTTLYNLLKPGGQLIIGNFHRDCPDKTFLEYWCDWVLYYRSKEDMLQLTQSRNPLMRRVLLDPTGCQMFLQVIAGPEAESSIKEP